MAGAAHCAIPATFDDQDGLTIDDSGVSGRLLMLGRPDSSFLIVPATTGDSRSDWALLASDGCIASRVEMWDRTRDLFHVTVDCAQPLFRFGGDAAMACALLSRQVYLALASDSIGLAAGVLSRTVEYLNTRIQFGKPLGTLQALKHRVAQHAANLSVYSALLEQALEAAPRDADLWATIAKADITAGCAAIAADCIQLHGGVGHTWEFDIHIFVKRAKLNEMLGGDNRRLRDQAANSFVKAARENRTTLEFQA
ncbi:MAG TPA: acyl-CoA dehydrogenase family protein [Sphingobium sp.]|nr:acyl-CoA dehydrogenase family protein [Sphingobium sp.]